MTQALNKRLGTTNRKMSQLGVIMAQKGLTMGDLLAIV